MYNNIILQAKQQIKIELSFFYNNIIVKHFGNQLHLNKRLTKYKNMN